MYCVNREILSFNDGYSVCAYIECQNHLDIIITDTDMPGMDGLELLTAIKTKYPQKKIILMSESADRQEAASRLGADAFLTKPFGLKDLFSIVETFVVNGS